MERKNDFEWIKQHYYEDGGDIHWWIDDDNLADFLKEWGNESDEHEDLKKTDERTIRGRQYNEWMIGNVFGDYEGDFVDEDCPECEHLLVVPDRMEDYLTGKERFCSNGSCKYENEEMTTFWEKNEEEWDKIKDPNKKPEFKIKVAGETIFEFEKRVSLSMLESRGFFVRDDNYWTTCVTCKREIPADDFYIGQETGFAMITFSHDDCTNGGPSIGVPFKKKNQRRVGEVNK